MYCRSCGTKIVGPAENCFKCRADPVSGNAYCPGCGCPTQYFVKNCLKCGTPLSYTAPKTLTVSPRSKNISIFLALGLGFFTWLYTYHRDAKKFWLSLGLTLLVVMVLISTSRLVFGDLFTTGVPTGSSAYLLLLMMVSFVIACGLYAWSLLDVLRKPHNWYAQYPNC